MAPVAVSRHNTVCYINLHHSIAAITHFSVARPLCGSCFECCHSGSRANRLLVILDRGWPNQIIPCLTSPSRRPGWPHNAFKTRVACTCILYISYVQRHIYIHVHVHIHIYIYQDFSLLGDNYLNTKKTENDPSMLQKVFTVGLR